MNLQLENISKVGTGDIYALTVYDPNLDARFTVKVNKSNREEDLLEKMKAAHSKIIQKAGKVQEIETLLKPYVDNIDSLGW